MNIYRALGAQPRSRKPAFVTHDNEASLCVMAAIVGWLLDLLNGLVVTVDVVDISQGSIGICKVCKDKKTNEIKGG